MALTRHSGTWAAALVIGLLAADPAAPPAVVAAEKEGAAKAGGGEKDAAAAQRDLEAGIAALQAGRTDQAMHSLGAALAAGKLPPNQMARALYYRGLAYRKQGKPAQAISDLTSALWLKNGLDNSLRADALENRAAAYRDAGLSDQAAADEKKAAAAEQGRQPAAGSGGSSWSVTASPSPAAEPAPARSAAAAPAGGGGLGGFFGNLFGASPAPPEASAPARPPAAPAAPATPAAAAVAAAAWSENTEVLRKTERPVASRASFGSTEVAVAKEDRPAPPRSTGPVRTVDPPAAAPPAVVTGSTPADPPRPARPEPGIRLQVAAVRSLEEAQAIAARLGKMGVAELAGRQTEIDQSAVGNMGTLYRVRVGPFANADEPRLLCVKLRGSGLDCMIVPQ